MLPLSFAFALFMQVQVRVSVPVPVVRFEVAPQRVEVQPGVQVVEDYDEEVFFVDGRYWMRAPDGRWCRARDHRGGWVYVEPRVVPARLVRMPPGHYKHYRGRHGGPPPGDRRFARNDGPDYKVKQKHGVTVVKVKEGKKGKGRWK
jgi:hypothetical protein